jgi:hypothetical protein
MVDIVRPGKGGDLYNTLCDINWITSPSDGPSSCSYNIKASLASSWQRWRSSHAVRHRLDNHPFNFRATMAVAFTRTTISPCKTPSHTGISLGGILLYCPSPRGGILLFIYGGTEFNSRFIGILLSMVNTATTILLTADSRIIILESGRVRAKSMLVTCHK